MSKIQTADPESDAFWNAAADGRLLYSRCSECDEVAFPPRDLCAACGGGMVHAESAGEGEVLTWSRVHRSADTGFQDRLPYAVAIVALTEGFRMIANVEPQSEVAVGAPCALTFRPSPATGRNAPLFLISGAST